MGNLNKQKGVVLVGAILMILMVSGIAVSVMSGSALDSKMIIATQESYMTESVARGSTEEAIKDELAKFYRRSPTFTDEEKCLPVRVHHALYIGV